MEILFPKMRVNSREKRLYIARCIVRFITRG